MAFIDKSPYLLSWGNGDPIAKTYFDVFNYDKPVKYDCGSVRAVILTEKGILYKINLETKTIEEIKDIMQR